MEEYSVDIAKEETKEAIKKIIKSKTFKRRYNRVLNHIHKAAIRGEREYWWVPLRKDIITQVIYDRLQNNDFRVWTNNVGYTIKW